MKKITVSAPGKLMLLGEHAVVYNRPCLVTSVDQRMKITMEILDKQEFQLEAPDVKIIGYKKPIEKIGQGDIPKEAKFVEIAIKNILEKYKLLAGFKVSTSSEFSSQLGFGSSSAVTVCAIKAISELLHVKLSQRDIFDLAYKTVLDIQGKGSGFDTAAAVYGGTLYFLKGGKIIEKLSIQQLPLIVGYSGIKADTVSLINQVKEKFQNNQEYLEKIYNDIATLVEKAKEALLAEDWKTLGANMNKNQQCLKELGVSSQKLDTLIAASIRAGAYGAKLSGAGGGDNMIAISPEKKIKSVKEAITAAGGKVIHIKTNVEGVKIERVKKL